jgi:hypothetical protein
MGLVDANGMPIGQAGMSQVTNSDGIDFSDLERLYEVVMQRSRSNKGVAAIERRVYVQPGKVDAAIRFWKPIYFNRTVEGRLLNGIEAYELGDPAKTPGVKCDKGPYIAMCNLMALEAIKIMGDEMPTAEKASMLAFATDREKEISAFWKNMFAPTEFQANWAWNAVLAVLVGNPGAQSEILDKYREQLP